MSLRYKVLLLTLAPIVIMGAMQLLGLQRVIHSLDETLSLHQERTVFDIEHDLKALIDDLDRLALNLSRPRELVNAVQTADNDVLFDWSNAFVSKADSIIFTDAQGLVIARAPDEFRFGDSVASTQWYSRARQAGNYHGIANIDGHDCFISARSIRKYNDTSVGVVAVWQRITPSLLRRFVTDSNIVLTYAGRHDVIESRQYSVEPNRVLVLDSSINDYLDPGTFEVLILPDESHLQLTELKTSLYVTVLATSLFALAAMLYLLARQFKPYTAIVDTMLEYSRGTLSLKSMEGRLRSISTKPSQEIRHIADALLSMVRTLENNFRRIDHYTQQLEEMANTDALTNLHNRASMDTILERETTRSARYENPLSVILLDIDHFKRVNDTYGHELGDQVLELVAAILKNNCRNVDFVGRWGGEEFLVVCPEADAEQVTLMAERLRRAVARQIMPTGDPLTISLGVTQLKAGDSVHSLVARADQAMYMAKAEGRNLVRSI